MAPTPGGGDWGIDIMEEGREVILKWRENRLKKQARQRSILGFTVYSFNLKTLNTFFLNFNYMVFFHMLVAAVAVYLAKHFNLSFDIQSSLLISPIVFPLAFAINADFQRRDTVLEYIAHFESSGMVLYMCLREWRKDTGLDCDWINQVHDKLKSILFLLREYLFTNEDDNRKFILRAIYEDISDTNQMIEQMRTSKLQPNGPLMSRVIHLLSLMCLAFERLRVVKEYRSPRSIRAFNKVLIMLLPLIMAPYFVFLGKKSGNEWSPYFISVVVAFVFSALQGVQDKLDDPFDGMGEDDIKLNAIDEWTFDSFETTVQRFNVGRFNVSVERNDFPDKIYPRRKTSSFTTSSHSSINCIGNDIKLTRSKKISTHSLGSFEYFKRENARDPSFHPYREVLENMKPNTCIKTSRNLQRHYSDLDQKCMFDRERTTSHLHNPLPTDSEPLKFETRDKNVDVLFQYPDTDKIDMISEEQKFSVEQISRSENVLNTAEHCDQTVPFENTPVELPRENAWCFNDKVDNGITIGTISNGKEGNMIPSRNKSENQAEKTLKKMKRYFRISPIHEEPELYLEDESSCTSDPSLLNGPILQDVNKIPIKEKDDSTYVDRFSYSPPFNIESSRSPKKHSRVDIVDSNSNSNFVYDQHVKRKSSEIDISPYYEVDITLLTPPTKEKVKLKHCETDFVQSNNIHNRLS